MRRQFNKGELVMTTQVTRRYAAVAVITLVLGLVLLACSVRADVPVTGYTFNYPNTGLPSLLSLPQRTGSLALADFTGDGTMDAVMPGLCIAGVAIVSNDTATWVSTGAWPVAVAAGDFDSDGAADLAVCERDGGGVAIYASNGIGGLARGAFYATGIAPEAVLAVDLDKDGRLDLVAANRASETVVVLHNTGGGFVLQQTVPVSSDPNALVAADLDGDGWLDVAVACAADDTVKILKSTSGILSLAGTFEGGPYPVSVTAADLNGDGYMDLAAADREAPQVTVLLNDGTGQFTASDVLLVAPDYVTFEPPVDVQLVDTNGDGKIDIRSAGQTLLNDGTASFSISPGNASGSTIYAKAFLPGDPYLFLGLSARTAGSSGSYGPNMVAVTYQAPAAPAAVPGDITGDGHVNVVDLLTLAGSWGKGVDQAGFVPASDLNGDGRVDVTDLLILAANWGA